MKYSSLLVNSSKGVEEKNLAKILQCFDLFVQYSTSEGFGMPQVESAACGVKVMSVDFSAMSDVCGSVNGILVPVERYFQDHGTQTVRAMPDIQKTAQLMYDYLSKPAPLRYIEENLTRKLVQEKYNWKDVIAPLIEVFHQLPQKNWQTPKPILPIPPMPPEDVLHNIDNYEYTKWIVLDVLRAPKMLHSHTFLKYVHFLDFGVKYDRANVKEFNKKIFYEESKEFALNKINCEKVRQGLATLQEEDFIKYSGWRKDNDVDA
jgi:hypothetical protein